MYFQQRPDYLTAAANGIAAGSPQQTVRFQIQRTFPIEAILIRLSFSQTTDIASIWADGLQNILKNINLTISDGVRTRTVVDVPGPALLELGLQTRGAVPSETAQWLGNIVTNVPLGSVAASPTNVFKVGYGSQPNGAAATGATGIALPRSVALSYMMDCCPPELMDPLASAFLLPVTRYPSDPILTLTLGGQGDVDAAAAPTFTTGPIGIEVHIIRRFVNVTNFAFIDWDLTTQTQNFQGGIQNNFRIELPTPGSYFGTLYRGFCNSNVANFPTVRAFPSQVIASNGNTGNPEMRIESLGVNFRRFTLPALTAQNDLSRGGTTFYPFGGFFFTAALPAAATVPQSVAYFAASAYNDFLSDRVTDSTELGSVLDANIPVASGAQVNLFGNYGSSVASALGSLPSSLQMIHWRAYGNLNRLKGVR
jgi:hypothetical protein